ncbi:MAG: hypothetical protein HQL24_03680 [Candidatus Omnitrophica bacterium]|nr:hypothetical protein [Candidatus Omnitrophota bacterium]
MNMKNIFLLMAVCFCFGCGQSSVKEEAAVVNNAKPVAAQAQEQPAADSAVADSDQKIIPENNFNPFYVYRDRTSQENHFIPSGFMPNGKCLSFEDGWMLDCHSGKTCIKVVYDIACSNNDQRWAGIYWLNPPNNWGNRKGGFNLTGAQKLVFWAKGDKGGENIEEFLVGGILGDYPDSSKVTVGPVILTDQWREYTIDLRGKDLSYISGGFGWSANARANPQSCTFYLDDIRFE